MENYKVFNATNILIPNVEDKTSFSVIACDQFTSEIEYWNELESLVKNKPSLLNCILPEIYLEDNLEKRVEKINQNIVNYFNEGVFKSLEKGFILTVRKTAFVEKRIGLIGAIDLDCYSYKKGEKPLVRATEGTIEERIPPRLKIRKDAEIEFPHIMVLFDDENKEITEKLYENRANYQKIYDFDLNMGGGHVEGYFINDYSEIEKAFNKLLEEKRLISKYGYADKFMFAVGDGNHSLATAKTHWENLKKSLTEEEIKTHPARYALCEVNNIYDEGIYFEPIFRFIKVDNKEAFLDGLKKVEASYYLTFGEEILPCKNQTALPQSILNIDAFIKEFIAKNGGFVDYVHGEENLKNLCKGAENTIGILFDKLDKSDLFKYVSKNGSLPRKTFSMGEGIEKRYYLEGRKIKWLKFVNLVELLWQTPRLWRKLKAL